MRKSSVRADDIRPYKDAALLTGFPTKMFLKK